VWNIADAHGNAGIIRHQRNWMIGADQQLAAFLLDVEVFDLVG
jgi:hypothetical protein